MGRDKKQFSVRLPPDAANEVEQYADGHGISKADALRRAVDDFFVRTAPDGGEVIERVDELDAALDERVDELEQRQARADRADAFQNVANAVGLAFIAAWFAGVVAGIAALGLALGVLVLEVGALAYSVSVGGGRRE